MSSGARVNGGSLDLLESNPVVAPIGTTRLFRQGGLLKVSTDSGTPIVMFGEWAFVERKVITVDAQSYRLANLNGDLDEAYKVTVEGIGGIGAAAGLLSLRPNGLATNQSANGYEVDGAGAPANDTRTELTLGFSDAAGKRFMSEATLFAKTGSERLMLSQHRLSSISRSVSWGSTWTDTATNITFLDVFSANATGLGIGTVIMLYKRVIPV